MRKRIPGSICVASTDTVYTSRPRNLNRDRAYPASRATTVQTTMVPRLIMMECLK